MNGLYNIYRLFSAQFVFVKLYGDGQSRKHLVPNLLLKKSMREIHNRMVELK